MTDNQKATALNRQKTCSQCRQRLTLAEIYHYRELSLCEDCCIDLRSSRPRKTHWRYISSIKGEYLIPGENG